VQAPATNQTFLDHLALAVDDMAAAAASRLTICARIAPPARLRSPSPIAATGFAAHARGVGQVLRRGPAGYVDSRADIAKQRQQFVIAGRLRDQFVKALVRRPADGEPLGEVRLAETHAVPEVRDR